MHLRYANSIEKASSGILSIINEKFFRIFLIEQFLIDRSYEKHIKKLRENLKENVLPYTQRELITNNIL